MYTVMQILETGNTVVIQPRTVGDNERWFAVYIENARGDELSSAWGANLEDVLSDAFAMLPETEVLA